MKNVECYYCKVMVRRRRRRRRKRRSLENCVGNWLRCHDKT
jgi:hypothetical protein